MYVQASLTYQESSLLHVYIINTCRSYLCIRYLVPTSLRKDKQHRSERSFEMMHMKVGMEPLRGSFRKLLQVVDKLSNHKGKFVGALSIKLKNTGSDKM